MRILALCLMGMAMGGVREASAAVEKKVSDLSASPVSRTTDVQGETRSDAKTATMKDVGLLKTVTICRPPTGKGARTLKVYRRDAQGCRATYTKLGQEESVGENRSVEQCESVLVGIRKNLEAANWSCRGPNEVATIQSSESQVQ